MVEFKETMGGFEVNVNGKRFGWIDGRNGFFTDSTVVREFLAVSPADLRVIASKAEDVMRKAASDKFIQVAFTILKAK